MLFEQIKVPDRALGQTVVGNYDRSLLVFAHPRDRDRGNFKHAEPLCRFESAMPRQNRSGLVD